MKFFIIVAPLLLLFSLQPADSKKISIIRGLQGSEHAIPLDMVEDSVDDMYSDFREQMSNKVKTKYFNKENKGVFEKISIIRGLQGSEHAVPLDMVEDSVDDMYSGCREQMSNKVKTKYFNKENKGVFEKVWKRAVRCTSRNLNQENRDKALTEDHLHAICIYTSGYDNFYKQFNTAVLTNRSIYATTFKFHSLHFWLTSAIQILNSKNKSIRCYRRSKTEFTGKPNQIIRFGSFASSSLSPKLTPFGSKTCFIVYTRYGAYLKQYPELKDKEQEVLIPPYEKFKISEIQKKYKGRLSDCEVVYILKSIGVQSNLNCKAAN